MRRDRKKARVAFQDPITSPERFAKASTLLGPHHAQQFHPTMVWEKKKWECAACYGINPWASKYCSGCGCPWDNYSVIVKPKKTKREVAPETTDAESDYPNQGSQSKLKRLQRDLQVAQDELREVKKSQQSPEDQKREKTLSESSEDVGLLRAVKSMLKDKSIKNKTSTHAILANWIDEALENAQTLRTDSLPEIGSQVKSLASGLEVARKNLKTSQDRLQELKSALELEQQEYNYFETKVSKLKRKLHKAKRQEFLQDPDLSLAQSDSDEPDPLKMRLPKSVRQAIDLLQQAAVNPGSVDPDELQQAAHHVGLYSNKVPQRDGVRQNLFGGGGGARAGHRTPPEGRAQRPRSPSAYVQSSDDERAQRACRTTPGRKGPRESSRERSHAFRPDAAVSAQQQASTLFHEAVGRHQASSQAKGPEAKPAENGEAAASHPAKPAGPMGAQEQWETDASKWADRCQARFGQQIPSDMSADEGRGAHGANPFSESETSEGEAARTKQRNPIKHHADSRESRSHDLQRSRDVERQAKIEAKRFGAEGLPPHRESEHETGAHSEGTFREPPRATEES